MKKAISIWSFQDQENVRGCIDTAKKAGFDGIELALTENGSVSMETSRDDLLKIRAYADNLGIKIHSVATGLFWQYSLTANDCDTRCKALSIAEKQLETAYILGADSVLIIPGAVGIDFIPGCETVRYDDAYSRALEAAVKLSKTAEKFKVHIGFENVWNKFLLSPLEFRDFLDKVESPYVGAYFDVGNVLCSGYPEHWIEILGSRIKKVHFKDYRRDAHGLAGFVDLLSGDVSWSEVMCAFEKIGYHGWATAEMLPPYTHFPDQILYNTSASMDRILGRNQ